VVKQKKHFVFFDSAYQGFGSDDMDDDTYSLKLFSCHYDRCMLSASFSKNMGLYGERTGLISFVCTNSAEKDVMQTVLKDTVLPIYSNPPIHGARIVETILGDPALREQWLEEVRGMSRRLRGLR
jgi:aspartate aminotransferase